jgi:hypothetical protein
MTVSVEAQQFAEFLDSLSKRWVLADLAGGFDTWHAAAAV